MAKSVQNPKAIFGSHKAISGSHKKGISVVIKAIFGSHKAIFGSHKRFSVVIKANLGSHNSELPKQFSVVINQNFVKLRICRYYTISWPHQVAGFLSQYRGDHE